MPGPATNDPAITQLDVSGLEPPEPMEQVFDHLQQLQDRQLLRVRHRRDPFPIYPLLEKAGYKYCCVPRGPELFLIYIWPQSTPVDEAFCRANADGVA